MKIYQIIEIIKGIINDPFVTIDEDHAFKELHKIATGHPYFFRSPKYWENFEMYRDAFTEYDQDIGKEWVNWEDFYKKYPDCGDPQIREKGWCPYDRMDNEIHVYVNDISVELIMKNPE